MVNYTTLQHTNNAIFKSLRSEDTVDRNMQWTLRVFVALLNILWIAFFLRPDPFSVFVQRRSSDSSDEEMLFGEFCIEPQSHMNRTSAVHSIPITSNKTNNTNTTAENEIALSDAEAKDSGSESENSDTAVTASEYGTSEPVDAASVSTITEQLHDIGDVANRESNLTPDINKTNIAPKDLHSSRVSESDNRPPPPGSEPPIIDLKGTTPASPPLQGPTSSELTAASELISTSGSEAAGTHCSTASVQPNGNQHIRIKRHPVSCCLDFSRTRIPRRLIKGYLILTVPRCPLDAIVLITVKNKMICVDPHTKWVKNVLKHLQQGNQKFSPEEKVFTGC